MKTSTNRGQLDDLLPNPSDPVKADIRSRILYVLNTGAEILPTSGGLLEKLRSSLDSPEASLDNCERLIEVDPILTSRVFRLANSDAFGGTAANITEAVHHLGLKRLREVVFPAAVFSRLASLQLATSKDVFWLRAIFSGRLCQRISEAFFPTDGTEYLAGLLHDLGWLFLIKHCPEQWEEIVASAIPVADAELEMLPFGHADISGALAARSGLPQRVVSAIFQHGHPTGLYPDTTDGSFRSAKFLAAILNLCDRAADAQNMGLFAQPAMTLEDILHSDEMKLINRGGQISDFGSMVSEEALRAQQLFEDYFA